MSDQIGTSETNPIKIGSDVFVYYSVGDRNDKILKSNKPEKKGTWANISDDPQKRLKTFCNIFPRSKHVLDVVVDWRAKMVNSVDVETDLKTFKGKAADDQSLFRNKKIFMGDQLSWSLKLADLLAYREYAKGYLTEGPSDLMADIDEAYTIYKFVKDLRGFNGAVLTPQDVSDWTSILGEARFTALTEYVEKTVNGKPVIDAAGNPELTGQLRWKKVSDVNYAQALIGGAKLILDDIGRGGTGARFGCASKDEAMKLAIGDCQAAFKLLTEEKTENRSYFGIGECLLTEARLRMLRRLRKPATKPGEPGELVDTNDIIRNLLNKWLDNYQLGKSVTEEWTDAKGKAGNGTKTIQQWILDNKMITRYHSVDISEKDASVLAVIGIEYLRAAAEVELAKLESDSEDTVEIDKGVARCNKAIADLEGLTAKAAELGVSNDGAVYAKKSGDYLHFDALMTKAELIAHHGNVAGYDTEVKKLGEALTICETIDDFETECPYGDIHARVLILKSSIKQALERFSFDNIDDEIDDHYDAFPKNDEEDVMAYLYPGTYHFYRAKLEVAKMLVSRNEWEMKFPTAALVGWNETLSAGRRASLIKDAVLARSYAEEIIMMAPTIKAVSFKGVKDMINRARLAHIQANIRLLKLTPDEKKLELITGIKTEIDSLISDLKATIPNLMANKARKWPADANGIMADNAMDYPFYIDLYNEYAMVMEQEAILNTKNQREIDPTVPEVATAFNLVTAAYNDVLSLCGHKVSRSLYNRYVRPSDIAIRLLNIKALTSINTMARTGDVYERLQDTINAIDGIVGGSVAEKDLITVLGKKVSEMPALIASAKGEGVLRWVSLGKHKVIETDEKGNDKEVEKEIKVLAEVLENFYAFAHAMKAELSARQAYFMNRKEGKMVLVDKVMTDEVEVTVVDKKGVAKKEWKPREKVLAELFNKTYEAARIVFDPARRRADPFYVAANVAGVASVNSKYKGMRDTVLNIVYKEVYRGVLKRKESREIRFSYDFCEILAITASSLHNMALALDILPSLDGVITQNEVLLQTLKSNKNTKAYKDCVAILGDAYFWRANIRSWFYDDKNEAVDNGTITYTDETGNKTTVKLDLAWLNQSSRDYEQALRYVPNYVSAKVNKALVDYRIASMTCNLALMRGEGAAAIAAELASFGKIAKALNEVALMDVAHMPIPSVKARMMTDEDCKKRIASYSASKAQALLALRTMALTLRNMMQKGKVRISDLNDGIETRPKMGAHAPERYYEMRTRVGKVENASERARQIRQREEQTDRFGVKVYTGKYAGKADLPFEDAPYATIALDDAVGVLANMTVLGSDMTITNADDLLARAETLYGKASIESGAITELTDSEKRDYKIDEHSLRLIYLGELANLSMALEDDVPIATALREAYKTIGVDSDEAKTVRAFVMGWTAMASEGTEDLKAAAKMYASITSDNCDAEILDRWALILRTKFFKETTRDAGKAAEPLGAFDKVVAKDESFYGSDALINRANIEIGVEQPDKALGDAEKALMFITGRTCPAKEDAIDFYVEVIGSDPILRTSNLAMQALCYLAIARGWLYTKITDSAVRVQEGDALISRINDVIKLAEKIKTDWSMRLLLDRNSPSGLIYVKNEVTLSLAGAQAGRGN